MTFSFAVDLAWRNVWRQKKRTLITAAAIAGAMFLSLGTRSMQEGSYAHNLDNVTRFYSGYLQVQNKSFSENNSINELLPGSGDYRRLLEGVSGVSFTVPRIESFALAASGKKSKGVVVFGVDPDEENDYSRLAGKVKTGTYFSSPAEKTVLLGGKLASYFDLKVGDEIILYGQGYHGATAAGIFNVAGIIDFPDTRMDSMIVYLPLQSAQALYGTGDQVTTWVLHSDNLRRLHELKENVIRAAGGAAEVKTWDEASPELAQQVALDRAGGQFMVIVLYIVMGFSLFATIMMMTLERRREFGVMMAAGMGRLKLRMLVGLEALFLALFGVSLGLIVTLPVLTWFYFHPIPLTGEWAVVMKEYGFEPLLPFSLAPELFLIHTLIILGILLICLIYPYFKIGALKTAEALQK